ncbi:MAG TPA: site-specific integrase [Bacillota bacterium]|nr:site-specific integrase [Bacillota bacterium]
MAKKRANGEGSIYKRKDGTWAAQASIAGSKVYFYGRTQGEVKDKLADALEQARKGLYMKPTKQTFGEWLDLWLKEYAKPTIRPTTYDSYEYQIRIHIKPGLGSIPLKELQPAQIQKYYNSKLTEKIMDRRSEKTIKKHEQREKKDPSKKRKEKTLSPATIRRMHIIISEALEQALKEGIIIRNPAKATKPPKVEKKEARYLSPDELRSFLGTIKDDRWYPAIITALNTGCRLGELVALKWENVDLEKGVIFIKEAVSWVRQEIGWALTFHPPKSQKGLRNIPLPTEAIKVLKAHRKKQNQEKIKLGEAYTDSDRHFVFTWEDGRLVDPLYLSKHFSKLIKKYGLSLNFHGLRHSYATALLEAGEHPKVVQELLGDSTISVVLDTYSHVLPGLKERAASKLDSLFGPKKPSSAKEG